MAQETERDGRFGVHGGQYIPETLMNAVIELEEAYKRYKDDPKFNAELTELQEAVKAKKAEIKELRREEKSETQLVIMKAIEESGKTAEEVLAMIQRQ